ncbi:maleylpyruvate isomerase family mycothiol-dependent enzyme [Amorphus orientalis]|uniref:Maleylpyruvate isomerase n=1 Tax=Amorphus orientalis TaxID=649198 RepID=A0AAE3VQJ7_9HYPH|nr:maleylpyruvate isomerase family mycothiol-dependent enzyme [Amorphus orientalis]MDQ0316355.1 maleylpyruvate isomerase [Amorphus orientalis]
MSDPEDAARAALRERQGAGARYDAAAAPHADLVWARRGTAYFARKLNELADNELDQPSLVDGWNRRQVAAHVGYHARALSRLVDWARTGVETPMYASEEQHAEEVASGATLPSRALRNLFHHTEVHLNVEWRDLTDQGWDAVVRDDAGRDLPIRRTPFLRAREVWVRAVDLDNGGSFRDFPPEFLDRLRDEIVAGWSASGEGPDLVLAASDRSETVSIGSGAGPTVSGRQADLVRWMTGRGTAGVASSAGELPALPLHR